uniref:Uncharacterized protein n=1 Tax=Rhizophora mucronata TaxID=61149 RepID=A0A2P2P419_RHIMU
MHTNVIIPDFNLEPCRETVWIDISQKLT